MCGTAGLLGQPSFSIGAPYSSKFNAELLADLLGTEFETLNPVSRYRLVVGLGLLLSEQMFEGAGVVRKNITVLGPDFGVP